MPVLDMLPMAYFVNGDNGAKKTTKQAWDKKFITAEEIAVIVPIPEAVLDDAEYDIWAEVKPSAVVTLGAADSLYDKIMAEDRRGCRRSYTWNGFVEMLKYYPLAKPKTYYCLY